MPGVGPAVVVARRWAAAARAGKRPLSQFTNSNVQDWVRGYQVEVRVHHVARAVALLRDGLAQRSNHIFA